MINDYVRMVHSAMMGVKEKIIMVQKNMLSKDDISLIEELEVIYHKEVKISTLQEIMNNTDTNVYVVQ